MKSLAAVLAFVFVAAISSPVEAAPQEPAAKTMADGQQSTGASSSNGSTGSAPQSRIDPAKEADIRKLMQLTGGSGLAKQLMDSMESNLKPVMANSLPPGDYRERLIDLFFQTFQAKADPQQLIDMMIPIYDKYLSDEDIKGLTQFYGTPLGQKALSVLPQLSIEAQGQGAKWGENLGRESMIEVLSEHPDLAEALRNAQKAIAPR